MDYTYLLEFLALTQLINNILLLAILIPTLLKAFKKADK